MLIPWKTPYKQCPLIQPIEEWFYSWEIGLILKDWQWCNGDCVKHPMEFK